MKQILLPNDANERRNINHELISASQKKEKKKKKKPEVSIRGSRCDFLVVCVSSFANQDEL